MPEPVAGQEAARVLEKSWPRLPEMAAAKKTSKTDLASLKPAGLCVFFFFLIFLILK